MREMMMASCEVGEKPEEITNTLSKDSKKQIDSERFQKVLKISDQILDTFITECPKDDILIQFRVNEGPSPVCAMRFKTDPGFMMESSLQTIRMAMVQILKGADKKSKDKMIIRLSDEFDGIIKLLTIGEE